MPAIGEVIPKCILSGPPRKGYIHARNSVAPLSVSPWLGCKKRLNPNLYAVISVSLEFVSTKLVSLPIQSPSVSDPSPKGTDDSAAHVDKLEPWKTPQVSHMERYWPMLHPPLSCSICQSRLLLSLHCDWTACAKWH